MSVGQHPSDFVGYKVGKPTTTTQVGLVGLLDFAGYSVGVPSAPATQVGFVGLLDFAGYPVGVSEVVPPVPVVPSFRPGLIPAQVDYGRIRRRREDDEIIILK